MTASFVVPRDHPSLPGHFPGHPIVPGVVLLDQALTIVAGARTISRIERARFLRPVMPGAIVEVSWRETTKESLEIVCHTDGLRVLRCRAWFA